MNAPFGEGVVATYELKLKQVQERELPELTDEWVAENSEWASAEEMREAILVQMRRTQSSKRRCPSATPHSRAERTRVRRRRARSADQRRDERATARPRRTARCAEAHPGHFLAGDESEPGPAARRRCARTPPAPSDRPRDKRLGTGRAPRADTKRSTRSSHDGRVDERFGRSASFEPARHGARVTFRSEVAKMSFICAGRNDISFVTYAVSPTADRRSAVS